MTEAFNSTFVGAVALISLVMVQPSGSEILT